MLVYMLPLPTGDLLSADLNPPTLSGGKPVSTTLRPSPGCPCTSNISKCIFLSWLSKFPCHQPGIPTGQETRSRRTCMSHKFQGIRVCLQWHGEIMIQCREDQKCNLCGISDVSTDKEEPRIECRPHIRQTPAKPSTTYGANRPYKLPSQDLSLLCPYRTPRTPQMSQECAHDAMNQVSMEKRRYKKDN